MAYISLLVQYEDMFSDQFQMVEKFEYNYEKVVYPKCLVFGARKRVISDLLSRGIVVKNIKELEISYED